MTNGTRIFFGKLSQLENVRSESENQNFRKISIFPSIEELLTKEKPILRANITKGPYQNVDHYLDVQFRLTREDFIAPLRDAIQAYRQNKKSFDKKNQDVWMHEGVRIGETENTRQGEQTKLHFNDKQFNTINWDSSKRFIHRSLLCLSNDNFETIRYAVVVDSTPKDLKKGIVSVNFEDYTTQKNKWSNSRLEGVYTVAELQVFFEAYGPIFKGLQNFNKTNLPLQKYIINAQQQLELPAYLNPSSTYKFTIKSHDIEESDSLMSGNVLDIDDWPETEELDLDESQRRAMHLALTSTLAMIQGPPGTGKTHVALKIMQTLLNNQKVWTEQDKLGPILVVSMTNRALDQFLEGVLDFSKSIVRLGTRSESEKLKEYTLQFIQDQMKPLGIKETETKLEMIEQSLETNKEFIQNFDTYIYEERVFTYMSNYVQRLVESLQNGWNDIFKMDSVDTTWSPRSYLKTWLGVTLDKMFISNGELDKLLLRDGQDGVDKVCKKIKAVLGLRRLILTEVVNSPFDVNKKTHRYGDDYIEITFSRLPGVSAIKRKSRSMNIFNYFRNGIKYKARESQLLVDSGRLCIAIAQTKLDKFDVMTDEEISCVRNVWSLSLKNRWRLFLKLRNNLRDCIFTKISKLQVEYGNTCKILRRIIAQEKKIILRKSDVIGMTTTSAAMNLEALNDIKPKIVIVEEAAKVLESHIICALTSGTQHLILIGDHKQLRPQVNVNRLSQQYHLDISLFERLINNNTRYATLQIQHRMRPEISRLLVPYIYQNLRNHPVVEQYPQIKGIKSNMFFLNHNVMEDKTDDIECHLNTFEANYLVALCRYLLQSYTPSQITILTAYNGQLKALQKLMTSDILMGVRLTTIDGFQGEESDILLLSFVRNNKEGQIGFLKFNNRVNVAISRAKMGLYCVGNFELFAKKSNFWRSIMNYLKTKGLVGNKIPLKCEKHGTLIMVSTADDFKNLSCDSRCLKKCGQVLNCGHVCKRLLHDDPHICMECNVQVKQQLPCGHIVISKCHIDLTKYKCKVTVFRKLPHCHHYSDMFCYQSNIIDETDFKCDIKVFKKFPSCNHFCEMLCYQSNFIDVTDYVCNFKVERKLPRCGHPCVMFCYENPDKMSCQLKNCNFEQQVTITRVILVVVLVLLFFFYFF